MTKQDKHQQNLSSLKSRREFFKKRIHSEIKLQIKDLRKKLVQNSFSQKPDLSLHKKLLNELKEANEMLNSSQS